MAKYAISPSGETSMRQLASDIKSFPNDIVMAYMKLKKSIVSVEDGLGIYATEIFELVDQTQVSVDRNADGLEALAQRILKKADEIADLVKIGLVSQESISINNVCKTKKLYEMEIKEKYNDYLCDLLRFSEFPKTIDISKFDSKDLIKRTSEQTEFYRHEFNLNKNRLIEDWEKENNQKWPTYEKDIVNQYGEVIKKAGWKYDAHHIQPLTLGGVNNSFNITPLRYDVHSDHKGVHSVGSPYDSLEKFITGINSNE